MNNFWKGLWLVMFAGCLVYCTKTSFITSKDALLSTSTDTLHFDTVFTSAGSIAGRFKIFNQNQQKLRLSNIQLAGGASSYFKMNVDGTAGTSFKNIEIEAGDSLYIFVTVTINPSSANLPFVVQDSIKINFNGNEKIVQLDAFGQNARYLRGIRVTKDSSFNKTLPIVILGGLFIDPGARLTINEGCKIYAHADAPIIVNGTLLVQGDKYDSTRVRFQGDRLDTDFRDYPGSWPGIFFSPTSRNNILNYAIIKNAYQGIITSQPVFGLNPKIILNQCIIDNIYDAGIISDNSSITATNCLISNCGNNIALTGGGNYSFNHCTISSYSNSFINHKNPVLFVTNINSLGQTNALAANFRNCILYGDSGIVKNEIVADKKGSSTFTVSFQNVLYRNKDIPADATFINSINNTDPQYDSINVSKKIYNFRLKNSSPAINRGVNIGVLIDLDGKQRGGTAGLPDMGAYEY